MDDIRVQLHKAAFGPLHERSTVLLCAAIDEIERLRGTVQDLIDAYIADVNPNDQNHAAIEHARRNIQ